MPADLRHGSYTPTYIEREELHEELTGLTRWNDFDASEASRPAMSATLSAWMRA